MIFGGSKNVTIRGSLADRIKTRLDDLGKNPSAVALEAGLGRSSVRDIIVNGANPRIDTLKKLTGPLECSLEYLTGEVAEPGERPSQQESGGELQSAGRGRRAALVETGVFRPYGKGAPERSRLVDPMMINEQNYRGYAYSMAEVGDTTLRSFLIDQGDLLIVAKKIKEPTPIRPGDLLYTALVLRSPAILSEHAIRSVEVIDGEVVLRSHGGSNDFSDLRLSEQAVDIEQWEKELLDRGNFNVYATTDGNSVFVFGVVVRVVRTMTPPV